MSTADAEFRSYVAERWPAVVRTAYLLCGDRMHAEDLAQAGFVQLHRHWRRVNAAGPPDAYLRRIVVNLANRRRVRDRPELLVPAVHDSAQPEPGFTAVEERDELFTALRQLPPRMRAVLVLRYYEQLTERETADALGCAVGTVKSHSSQGLQRLRQLLDDRPARAEENR